MAVPSIPSTNRKRPEIVMMRACVALCLSVVAGMARAEHADVNLSDSTVRAVYGAPLMRLNGTYELGALLGERNDRSYQQVHMGVLATGDAGARDANITAG